MVNPFSGCLLKINASICLIPMILTYLSIPRRLIMWIIFSNIICLIIISYKDKWIDSALTNLYQVKYIRNSILDRSSFDTYKS